MSRITLVLALLCMGSIQVGCVESPSVTCQPSLRCGTIDVQTCCSMSHCEYRLAQQVWPCQGTDCTAASVQVRAVCPDPCGDAALDLDGGDALDASGCLR